MIAFNILDDLDVAGKRVLVRADLNVPMEDGTITDATRIARTAPTVIELAGKDARVVVMSHLGRPQGKRVDALTLRPVADALSTATKRPVAFADDCVGPLAAEAAAALADGDILLLENLRFHPGEETNDRAFAVRLAALGDIYVGDAFSCAHRAHASTEGVARLMRAVAGRLMQSELEALAEALEAPRRPLAALVGGAKVSTKLGVLGHLVEMVDVLIIGGGMANTFLNARGAAVGRSLCEHEMADRALAIMAAARQAGCDIVLPVDAVVAGEAVPGAAARTVPVDRVAESEMILDLGPATVCEVEARLEASATLVWNGPLGVFEVPPFDAATNRVAQAAARLTREGRLFSVAGGGDTMAALGHAGVVDDFSYVSTAGGAFLEWLEGRTLPGVAVLGKSR